MGGEITLTAIILCMVFVFLARATVTLQESVHAALRQPHPWTISDTFALLAIICGAVAVVCGVAWLWGMLP